MTLSSSAPKAGSRSMRSWSVFQEGRVKRDMVSSLLSFAAFVFAPELSGSFDIPLLSLLRSATQKDKQNIAFSTKVDPIAGAKVYPAFNDACTHTSCIGKVTILHPGQCFCHSG